MADQIDRKNGNLEDSPLLLELASLFLEFLAERTGNRTYLRSARTLFQQPPGLPEIDDTADLEEVRTLLEGDHDRTVWAACKMVAMARCGAADPTSYAKRLQKKYPGFQQ